MPTTTTCPFCGKLTDPKLETCPHCGGQMRHGGQRGAQAQVCPNCKKPIQEGDIICVACGTNLITGHKVAEDTKRPRETSGSPIRLIVAIVAVAVIVIVAGLTVYILTRDPVKRAASLANQGRRLEAIEILEEYSAGKPDNLRAQSALARLYWQTENYASAAPTFQRVVELEGQNRDAALLAVLSAMRQPGYRPGQREAALLEGVLAENPQDGDALLLLAKVYGAMNNAEEQVETLDRALALNEGDPVIRQSLGAALALQGNTLRASELLERSAQAQPGDSSAAAAAGYAAVLAGDYERAAAYLKEAAASPEGDVAAALTALGVALAGEGRLEEADDYLQQAIERGGAPPLAHFFHGVCLQGTGQDTAALSVFSMLAAGTSDLAGNAALREGQLHLDRGNLDKASSALLQARQAENVSEAALLTLEGRLEAATGDLAAAQSTLKRAIAADGTYAPAHLELGLLYLKRQLPEDGAREINRYLELAPADAPGSRAAELAQFLEQLERSGGETLPATPGATLTLGRNAS